MNTYLIQRCESRSGNDFTCFDSAFRCDYMGEAVFEFGALLRSLRRVVAQTYTARPTGVCAYDGRSLHSICHSDAQHAEVAALVPDLLGCKIRLKEPSYLPDILGSASRISRAVDLWWDIENDWFLALGEPAAQRILLTIERQRQKWAKK